MLLKDRIEIKICYIVKIEQQIIDEILTYVTNVLHKIKLIELYIFYLVMT